MQYKRMPIEIESPEEMGYSTIRYNLAESSVRDRTLQELNIDLSNIVLAYGEHKGILPLRTLITEGSDIITPDDVLVTTGAAMALFVISTTLLSPTDHIIVIRPNYATNLETPRAIACEMSIVDLDFDAQYGLNTVDEGNPDAFGKGVLSQIRPNTKLISLTNPHNPTGKIFPHETLLEIIKAANSKGIYVVMDETYRDLNFQTPLLPYYAEVSPNVISVGSMSKSFGIPGIRIGWLICRDAVLMDTLLAAKEQMILGNAVINEEIAYQVLSRKKEIIAQEHADIRLKFDYMKLWMQSQKYLEWVEPQAGVVCFPRVKKEYNFDFIGFQHALYHDYQTVVGYGHWFEQSQRHFRIGYAYPSFEDLKVGLDCFSQCLVKFVV
jgi:aspartate/methionine/tyrosine aminotransferase